MTLTSPVWHLQDQATMLLTLRRAQAALRVLPDKPPAIAEYLHCFGCRGQVGTGHGDALEAYLQASTGETVDLHPESAEWGTRSWSFTLSLPDHVAHFLVNYDHGDYSELYGPTSSGTTELIGEAELSGLAEMEL